MQIEKLKEEYKSTIEVTEECGYLCKVYTVPAIRQVPVYPSLHFHIGVWVFFRV